MIEIIEALKKYGPLTGRELKEKISADSLKLWRFCNLSNQVTVRIIGKNYLRLDKRIEGYARLSPSILREFLTYTVIGLTEDVENINIKAKALSEKIKKTSRDKLELAETIIRDTLRSHKHLKDIEEKAVFIIAGDIVYEMAHSEARPESSTGGIIRGSDLDIIIVTKNLASQTVKELDELIYGKKYYFMKNPAYREEIDYIIKDISKVKKQLSFNSFEFMVASKILNEGRYLYGSNDLFEEIKRMLNDYGISAKISALIKIAAYERKKAAEFLLGKEASLDNDAYNRLFFTKEESDEIF